MTFTDITLDTKSLYTLGPNEKRVFFFCNRSGDITFELAGENAEAHIIALFTLSDTDRLPISVTHIHRASNTTSSFVGRSALSGNSLLDWKGLVRIEPHAKQSNAHQEMKNLLLSPDARAKTIPSLEIKNDDVRCGHAATASAPNPDHLFFLESRGIKQSAARLLLTEGFLREALKQDVFTGELRDQLIKQYIEPYVR